MTDYESPSEPIHTDPVSGSESGTGERSGLDEAWSDVTESLDELGKAVGAWARSVKDDPQNRRRATELKDGLEGVGRQIGDAVDSASKTDFAQSVGNVAVKTGDIVIDSAKRVGDEVAPALASAFKSAAVGLRQAAERMEQKAARPTAVVETPAPASQPSTPPSPTAPYTGEEPPAPSPSGVHEEESDL